MDKMIKDWEAWYEYYAKSTYIAEFEEWKDNSFRNRKDFEEWEETLEGWLETLTESDIIDMLMKYGKYISYSEFEWKIEWEKEWAKKHTKDGAIKDYPYLENAEMCWLEDKLIKGETNGK